MATEVILPKVDMDMATGQIARWFAKEGDRVTKGEPLFEIETDKAAMEVDAPASGTLRNVTGKEGIDIAVGEAVAWIFAEGEAEPQRPVGKTRAPEAVADAVASDAEAEREKPAPAVAAPSVEPAGAKTRATPVARRLARENGLAIASVQGSGPKGRVMREDVEAELAAMRGAIEAGGARTATEVPRPVICAAPGLAPSAAGSKAAGPLHAVWLRAGAGTPLVLIHGFGAEIASWRPLLSAFDRTVPILGLDLPGHGGSAGIEAQSFDDLVAGVEATLAANGVMAAHLVGHSLGGAVAASVASGVSLEARSLFLIAPAGLGAEINTAFTNGFAAARDEQAVRTWMNELVVDPDVLSDGFVKATARARADGTLSAAQLRLAGMLFSSGTQRTSTRALFQHLAMPVKIVVGTADRIIPAAQARGLPGHVALHAFADVGHMPHLERRLDVARLIGEIIGGLGR